MAQYEGSYQESEQRARAAETHEPSGWAIGFIFFASMMMLMVGSFHFIEGFAAVLNDTFYVVRPGYDLAVDVTTWGWVHMGIAVLMIAAGLGIMTGAMWARIIAIILAVVSTIANFYSIPYYPVWSILIIAMNIGVIWALTAHGRDLAMDSEF